MKRALLIGYGAIGSLVLAQLANDRAIRITHVLERSTRRAALQRVLGDSVTVIADPAELDSLPVCALECAGHAAVRDFVVPLLVQGVDAAVVSVGALADAELAEALEAAAMRGGSQLTLVSGAIGGIDAISSARVGGLDHVRYTGRKPPLGWQGTPAERAFDLAKIAKPQVIFEGAAREAARLYPKNANVAATVALAGIGLDRTQVQLVADPAVDRNHHHVSLHGAFGDMELSMSGRPLPDNPKTSSLAAYSAVRALRNFGALVRF